jgi:hypothetical protein
LRVPVVAVVVNEAPKLLVRDKTAVATVVWPRLVRQVRQTLEAVAAVPVAKLEPSWVVPAVPVLSFCQSLQALQSRSLPV